MKSSRLMGLIALCCLFALGSFNASAACKVDNLVDIPVTMTGMQPIVEATFEGKAVRLMADSGAFFGIVHGTTAAHYKLKMSQAPMGMYVRGATGTANFSVGTVHDFGLAGLKLNHVPFLVIDNDLPESIDGVLGQNVLGLADIEYDLSGGLLRIMRPHDCADVFLGYWAPASQINVIELDRGSSDETSTTGIGYVNGNKIKILFDTGAESSFLSLEAAARAGVKPDDPGVVPGGTVHGGGHRHPESWIAPFSVFRMGKEEIRHTHLRIADLDLGDADMVLGADYFLSHHVYVANSQKKIYVSYTGGAVFNLTTGFAEKSATPSTAATTTVAADGVTPLDAEGFARRSAASVSRRDFAAALSDLNQACSLAPKEAKYLVQRSRVYFSMGKHAESIGDLDRALALRPDDYDTQLLRADTRRRDGKTDEGLADVQAVDKAVAQADPIRFEIGEAYLAADQFAQAVAQFDQWIPAHSTDSRLGSALNARCWARALWGRELEQAADDCNGALKRAQKGDSLYAAAIDSRAMVRLRQGDCASAIHDYNEALAVAPDSAWSLFGRGICRLRKGDATNGNADLAAARALSGGIDARARKFGIAP